MKNLKLTLAYDGTDFLGWQQTPLGPSIEQEVRTQCEKILRHPISLQAVSRTDSGVHAAGQVVNFFTEKELHLEGFCRRLNALLPKSISLVACEEMPLTFHPTLDATRKEYHYFLCLGAVQLPHVRRFSWHVPTPLNQRAMEEAIPLLTGTRDFSAFCNKLSTLQYGDRIRSLHEISLEPLPENRLCVKVLGDHFLYKMVRNIVGTLVYVGRGKLSLEALPKILEGKKRCAAGITAPAHGLLLKRVYYDRTQ